VTLSGVTAQFLQSAKFGEGAVAAHPERVVIQRQTGKKWQTVRIVRSNLRGRFTARFTARAAAVYRVEPPRRYRAFVHSDRVVARRTDGGTVAQPRARQWPDEAVEGAVIERAPPSLLVPPAPPLHPIADNSLAVVTTRTGRHQHTSLVGTGRADLEPPVTPEIEGGAADLLRCGNDHRTLPRLDH